jgi:hypothetical protein
MIERHIAILLDRDPFFRQYWEELTPPARQQRLDVTRRLEEIHPDADEVAHAEYAWSSEKMRRYLSCIPQRDPDFERRPKAWLDLIQEQETMHRVHDRARNELEAFRAAAGAPATRLYGGLKPIASLDTSFEQPKPHWAARRNRRDAWDAVRFRIVCEDVIALRTTCMQMLQYFIDDVVKCRNYYTAGIGINDLYRAVHFELAIERGCVVEVQILTELRDWIGFLDYSFTFKKKLHFLDQAHEEWLAALAARATIADARRLRDAEVLMPEVTVQRFARWREPPAEVT